jgi:SAM-dependent methyltransferase
VVDLGTGTGRFALAAARRFGHVTAVDVSPAMLALLRERAADAGLGNLDCVRAGLPMLAATGSRWSPHSSGAVCTAPIPVSSADPPGPDSR